MSSSYSFEFALIMFLLFFLFIAFSTHMQDLTEVTQEVHYENYRSDRLAKGGPLSSTHTSAVSISNGDSICSSTTSLKKEPEKDKMIEELQEKEAQIKKMQEMMARMQAQLQEKN